MADEPYISQASVENLEGAAVDNESREDASEDKGDESGEQQDDSKQDDDGDSKEEASADEAAEQGIIIGIYLTSLKFRP